MVAAQRTPARTMMALLAAPRGAGAGIVAKGMDDADVATLMRWRFANICADLVLFDPATVTDHASFDTPQATASGIQGDCGILPVALEYRAAAIRTVPRSSSISA